MSYVLKLITAAEGLSLSETETYLCTCLILKTFF